MPVKRPKLQPALAVLDSKLPWQKSEHCLLENSAAVGVTDCSRDGEAHSLCENMYSNKPRKGVNPKMFSH